MKVASHSHTTINPPAERRSHSSRYLLLLALAFLCGCPSIPIGDPIAHTRILNDTATAILVTLGLDASTEGADDPEFVQRQLHQFTEGQGVSIETMNPESLTATYRVDPAGFMVVYSGMGTKPYFGFTRMVLSVISPDTDSPTTGLRTFTGNKELEQAFESGRGRPNSFPFELRISTVF